MLCYIITLLTDWNVLFLCNLLAYKLTANIHVPVALVYFVQKVLKSGTRCFGLKMILPNSFVGCV